MRKFKPKSPFNVAMKILTPTSQMIQGVAKQTFSDPESSELIFGSFKTFGGTENTRNGVYTLIDTAVIETWYRPDIKADCRIYLCETEQSYEIISDPENIDMRHQYLQFKVRKIGSNA